MIPANDPLSIETPAPGAIFQEHYIHPNNLALLDDDDRARKLTRDQIKAMKRARTEYQTILDEHRFDDRLVAYKRLKEQGRQLKLDIARLEKLEDHDPDALDALKARLDALRHKGARWAQIIEPDRELWRKVHYINNRLQEHYTVIENERQAKLDREQMMREVAHFWTRIRERYAWLKFRHDVHRGDELIRHKVQCERAWVTEDEIIFKLAVQKVSLFGSNRNLLPDNVRVRDLVKPETLDELAAACERPVYSPHNEYNKDFSNGAFVIVSRLGSMGGLPEYIELDKLLAKYKQDQKDRVPVPLGVRKGRKINWAYLSETPHYMINGISGSGKTNALRVIVSTVAQMHKPDEVRLVLIDLKHGGDFNYFKDIPHLLGGIVYEIPTLENILVRLVNLMRWRMQRFSETNAWDLNLYNQRVDEDQRMPRIIVIADEYAAVNQLRASTQTRANIHDCAALIAAQARAAGIHLVLGTQQSFSDSIPKPVRDNIGYVLSGRQRTLGASLGTFGDGRSRKISDIKGRMICDNNGKLFDVQIPFVTPTQIETALDAAMRQSSPHEIPGFDDFSPDDLDRDGDGMIHLDTATTAFNEQDVLEIALAQFNGDLKAKNIWEYATASGRRVGEKTVRRMVKDIVDRDSIEYEGTIYTTRKMPGNYDRLEIDEDVIGSFAV